jgi:hypothetical protein
MHVRARIARIDMSAANKHRATRSGGRKPPVVSQTRLQRRSPNTRETADAAPENLIAIAAARITARLLRFAILLTCASSNHGGLTPAGLYACACAYRKNRHVCGERTPCTKSGGRQPPVVRQPCLQGRFRTRSPRPSHRQPGAGGVSPPWITKTRLQRRSPNTRETADAAPENLIAIPAARITARLLRFAILLTCASSSHGGLTPAALVHVRLYIANGALCSARTSRTKSGRCKPTVENVRDCTSVSNTTAGSRPPLWCSSLR